MSSSFLEQHMKKLKLNFARGATISLFITILTGFFFLKPINKVEIIHMNRSAFDPTNSEPITIMSYNIRLDTPVDEGIYDWSERKDIVAEIIGPRYGADIVGLQEPIGFRESRRNQIEDLQELLPEYSWVGVGRDDGEDGGEFSPIFYRKDLFKVLESKTFWFSETPDNPGSVGWDAVYPRIVTWALLYEFKTEKKFYVFNTHFDHRGSQARIESAKMLAEHISGLPKEKPVIITGDLNQPEESEVYSIITSISGIKDARYASETGHSGPTATSTTNNWQDLRPEESRIDYIFVGNGIRVLNHRIKDDRFHNIFPSDHLPVISDVVLP